MDKMTKSMVTVATFGIPFDAHIARGRLEDAGVHVHIADEHLVGVASHLGPAVGGIKVQVRASDAERALSILNAPSPIESAAPKTEEESNQLEDLSHRALATAFFGIVIPPLQLYSMWLIGRLLLSRDARSRSIQRRVIFAATLDLWVFVLMAAYIVVA